RRFTQNVLIRLPEHISGPRVAQILQALLDRHDMLRAVLDDSDAEYRLTTRPPGAVQAGDVLTVVDASAQDALSAEVVAALDRIDP
ncbi:peptide synthetase, partial [Mycobacterium sp. ITM-2017-0098]